MKEKKNRKSFKLKNFDLFSVPFNFTYKKEDKYSTTIGGIMTIIYVLLILAYLIYHFIPFVKKNKYDIVYYEENKDTTDELNFNNSENYLAFQLEPKRNDNTTLTCENLLDINVSYIRNEKEVRPKSQEEISTYNCKYDREKKKFIPDETSTLKCLVNPKNIITNDYNHPSYFTYYQITAYLKDSSEENNIINSLLINDCKLNFYYLDYTIKVEDYNEPVVPYQSSLFLQLNPNSILQMNVYFMKQILKDLRNILFLTDREKTKENIVFSRIEQYSYYKGENRTEHKKKFNNSESDYNIYAKIYVRADTKELKVTRKYQTLGGFYAESTQIFWDLFTFCNILIGAAYNFLSYHSLS